MERMPTKSKEWIFQQSIQPRILCSLLVGHSHLHHFRLRKEGETVSQIFAWHAKESQQHFRDWELHKATVAFEFLGKDVEDDISKTDDEVQGVKSHR